jgi:hypothetical protein
MHVKNSKANEKKFKSPSIFFWVGPFFGKSDGEATNQQLFMMKYRYLI